MTAVDTGRDLAASKSAADRLFRRKRLIGAAIPAVIGLYLVYIFFAFDLPGLAQRADWDNAVTLASDSWSHKVHVTHDIRSGEIDYAVEGERKGRFPDGRRPAWVSGQEVVTIELGPGHVVRTLPGNRTEIEIPDFPLIEVRAEGRRLVSNLSDALPDWISASSRRIAITTQEGRITLTGARTEVFNYFPGWELFWVTLDSPYHGQSLGAILFGERLDPARPNLSGAVSDWWNNAMWRHKDVAWAIGETILMACLGARRFSPIMLLRAAIRRLFDFVRGVDALIWTVVLSRAFGPCPLTGALAMLVTDTGTFGKIFSEALENVDDNQIEGVASTGAKPVQRYRFGVIPQVTPVLLSQLLYFLESNTRSATIIGAITGGGIGLLLTQAIITQKDWEEVSYYIVLILIMVMVMDTVSGWLRRRLITSDDSGQ